MVEEQFRWEKSVVRFNPDLDINFDTSGVPPLILPGRELLFVSFSSGDAASPPDAEVGGGSEGGGGEVVPEAEPAAEEVPEQRANA
ncbi:hypothetical protein Pyn_09766 [Prunus yedoensis var. nudiflora]|uniref:Uncharacterized protein n=1 Tax=Prunus yedoensis var. nudiflora TaxID=2094558 RepID=A0A314ZAW6_PRUYE|nr:hypothetical protein Pyn_09766 [Prunus yedoensis var. nudiflora]